MPAFPSPCWIGGLNCALCYRGVSCRRDCFGVRFSLWMPMQIWRLCVAPKDARCYVMLVIAVGCQSGGAGEFFRARHSVICLRTLDQIQRILEEYVFTHLTSLFSINHFKVALATITSLYIVFCLTIFIFQIQQFIHVLKINKTYPKLNLFLWD